MCGITGILGSVDRHPDLTLVQRMNDIQAHRGPDDAGCADLGELVVAMRRLSILDPTPAGHQPMSSPDGRFTIVFNGEIYNFLELADELAAAGHSFSSAADTEVLLTAYAAWGPDCVRRLNGIFAFAIWDRVEKSLFLARDRFGVKPLYLAEGAGFLAFASEIKSLRLLPWVSNAPEPSVTRHYLADGCLSRGCRTFYRDIQCFPPSASLLVTPTGRRWNTYWTAPELSTDTSFRPQPGDADRIEEIRQLLYEAVGIQLRSDVAIGSCLSGGMDSSSIVSIAARRRAQAGPPDGERRQHTERDATPQLAFFAEFREAGIDERPYVDAVVAATGVGLHTTTPDTAQFIESLPGILRAQDEPFGTTSIVAQYHVMKIAHEAGVKVLLDGQGADELFGGYLRYPGYRFGGALRSGRPGPTIDALRAIAGHHAPVKSSLIYALIGARPLPLRLNRRRMPEAWLGGELHGAGPMFAAAAASGCDGAPSNCDDAVVHSRHGGTVLASTLWRDVMSDNLPELLRYEDRNSMAFGIEARVPFLDHRLAEAALRLPDRLRIAGVRERKVALKRAVTGLVPDAVLARRDKVAFQSPEKRWLTEAEPLWRHLAAQSRAEQAGLLAPGAMTQAIDAFLADRVVSPVLWRILNLEMWLRDTNGEPPLGEAAPDRRTEVLTESATVAAGRC